MKTVLTLQLNDVILSYQDSTNTPKYYDFRTQKLVNNKWQNIEKEKIHKGDTIRILNSDCQLEMNNVEVIADSDSYCDYAPFESWHVGYHIEK